jgi:hypothetical protein
LLSSRYKLNAEGGNCEEITSICDAWNFNYGKGNRFSVLLWISVGRIVKDWQQNEVVWVIMKSLSSKNSTLVLRNSQTEIKFAIPLMFSSWISFIHWTFPLKKLLFRSLPAKSEHGKSFSIFFKFHLSINSHLD